MDIKCEMCGCLMKSCNPYKEKNLCIYCIRKLKGRPKYDCFVGCGNDTPDKDWYQRNENDNIAKLLEGE